MRKLTDKEWTVLVLALRRAYDDVKDLSDPWLREMAKERGELLVLLHNADFFVDELDKGGKRDENINQG